MADYTLQPNGVGAPMPNDGPAEDGDNGIYFDVGRLKKQYYDYLGTKMAEIEEQKEARRYYHGAQWSDKEIKILKKRRQPVITSNRIVRKVDAVVGLIERLRQTRKPIRAHRIRIKGLTWQRPRSAMCSTMWTGNPSLREWHAMPRLTVYVV